MLPAADRRALYRASLAFAELARRVILARARSGFRKRLKPDASYVTDADLAAERALRAAIAKRFPAHGILGEELPPLRPEADFQWILDPIDGTLSFAHGIPFFGTILAVHHRGRPVAGVIDHAALDVRFSAGDGLGAFRNGRRLRIRDLGPRDDIRREVLAAGDRSQFVRSGHVRSFDALMRCHPHVRVYTDCLGHGLAAQGAVAAMVDYGLKAWDVAATRLLIEEAGGRYVERRSIKDGKTSYGVICGKPAAVAWVSRFF